MQNIHPYFVHFPIAILTFSIVCDFLGAIFNKESFRNAAWWALVFGSIAIVATLVTGLIAESTVVHSDEAHPLIEQHKFLEIFAASLFIGLLGCRAWLKRQPNIKKTLIVTYIIGASFAGGLMLLGAHYGGRMVYEYGVGGSAVQVHTTHDHGAHD